MIVALLNQKCGADNTTLVLHLAGVCACQSQRASAKEGLPRRCALIDLARDALNHDAPKIACDLDRATIDRPSHIGVLAPSALLAAEVVVAPTQPRLFGGSAFAETLRLVQGTSILRPQLRVRLALNRCDVRIVAASETARALADDDRHGCIRAALPGVGAGARCRHTRPPRT